MTKMEAWLENINQIVLALKAGDAASALEWVEYLRADLASHLASVKEPA